MIYLDSFCFATPADEENFLFGLRRTCYDTCYPFGIFNKIGWERVDFEPITLFYGGNGSGKSTALNVIAEKIGSKRETVYNRSNFFDTYVEHCKADFENEDYLHNDIITSDGVFDHMLDIRNLNEQIDRKREDLFEDYMDMKYHSYQLKSLEDFEEFRRVNQAKRKTQSKFIRSNLADNVREYSNGESAFRYFVNKIEGEGIYILDEPENSLSPKRQLELVKYIEESARYYQCQFIVSTHSPFLLSVHGAKIYDLDENPVDLKRWTELSNVRIYYDFFREHKEEFQ